MTIARILSVAAVAAFASVGAHADTYGIVSLNDVQSTRARAEVQAEAVKAAPNFKNFAVAQDTASTVSREAVRADAVTAARAGAIGIGNRG